MSSVPNTLMSEAEYLEFERKSEIRHEFYQGQIFAMTGATANHNWIKSSIEFALRERLRGSKCRPYSSDMRVSVQGSGLYTYPDVVVACPPEFKDDRTDTLINPQVVIEVLSPSTEDYDRGKKFDLYRQSPALQQYILVSQDSPRVISFVRQSDGVAWLMNPLDGMTAELDFPTLSVSVSLSEIFRDIEFSQTSVIAESPTPPMAEQV